MAPLLEPAGAAPPDETAGALLGETAGALFGGMAGPAPLRKTAGRALCETAGTAPPAGAGSRAWLALGLLLAGGTLLAAGLRHADAAAARAASSRIDWQPALALTEPWRAFSAAFVHYSGLHLAANLAGVALTTALGVAAQLPARAALAWLLAWPLTQLGLLAQPALAHYGGLSGVLHAGVAVAAAQLWLGGSTAGQRRLGAAIALGLAGKVIAEAPWAGTLTHPGGWDIAVAPGAHLSGVCVGLLAGWAVQARPLQTPRSAASLPGNGS